MKRSEFLEKGREGIISFGPSNLPVGEFRATFAPGDDVSIRPISWVDQDGKERTATLSKVSMNLENDEINGVYEVDVDQALFTAYSQPSYREHTYRVVVKNEEAKRKDANGKTRMFPKSYFEGRIDTTQKEQQPTPEPTPEPKVETKVGKK